MALKLSDPKQVVSDVVRIESFDVTQLNSDHGPTMSIVYSAGTMDGAVFVVHKREMMGFSKKEVEATLQAEADLYDKLKRVLYSMLAGKVGEGQVE